MDTRYTKQFNIDENDVNGDGFLSLKSLAGILEETADGQLSSLELGTMGIQQKGMAWVIVRREVEINRLPRLGEKISSTTYAANARHGLYPRWYELKDENGGVLLTASCQWCVLDIVNREILFNDITTEGMPIVSKEEYGKKITTHFRFPELTEKTYRDVTKEYIDGNGHMNNRYYLKWAEEIARKEGLDIKDLTNLWIEYDRELMLGEKVELDFELLDEDSKVNLYIRGTSKGETNFVIRLSFSN